MLIRCAAGKFGRIVFASRGAMLAGSRFVREVGTSFCTSALATCKLTAKWPVQIAVNNLSNYVISFLMTTTVRGAGQGGDRGRKGATSWTV